MIYVMINEPYWQLNTQEKFHNGLRIKNHSQKWKDFSPSTSNS